MKKNLTHAIWPFLLYLIHFSGVAINRAPAGISIAWIATVKFYGNRVLHWDCYKL